jgi:hypothetical protein
LLSFSPLHTKPESDYASTPHHTTWHFFAYPFPVSRFNMWSQREKMESKIAKASVFLQIFYSVGNIKYFEFHILIVLKMHTMNCIPKFVYAAL